jgi:hypothetical protein
MARGTTSEGGPAREVSGHLVHGHAEKVWLHRSEGKQQGTNWVCGRIGLAHDELLRSRF